MDLPIRFQCKSCNEWHEGIPGWGWNFPFHYQSIPENEREKRCFLTTDLCVVDEEAFYVCGCLELPVSGSADILSFRVWVSLSEENFLAFQDLLGVQDRDANGPYFGWLSVSIPTYPETMNLKTMVHIRNDGTRPYVQLETVDHPLSIEQRSGVGLQRIRDLYTYFEQVAS